MPPTASPSRDDALVALFERHGCTPVDTPILQPAALFLELSGEDIRRRLYLTQDGEGGELCLRPEYTIPVCRLHVASGRAGGRYCYRGPVFRQRGGETGEFLQAGFELIGGDADERAEADAVALSIALAGLDLHGVACDLAVGDMNLLDAVMDALAVPAGRRRRIIRDLAAGRGIPDAADPAPAGEARQDYTGLLSAIGGQDPGAARAFIEDVISIAGIAQVGGRSAAIIAERFLDKAQARTRAVSDEARAVLRAYVAVADAPDRAATAIADLAGAAGLAIAPALDALARRTDAFARAGIDVSRLLFRTDFVRSLDFYTGMIFEARARDDGALVAAGGRYDDLLRHLGADRPVPSVGCSFWLDRLGARAP